MKSNLTGTITFTPAAKTLNFSAIPDFSLSGLLAVINTTRSVLIYAVGNADTGFTNYSAGVLTLTYNTTTHNAADVLQYIYERPDVETIIANITTQNLVPTGTATANSAVEINLNGAAQIAIQVTGTYTGALSVQVTNNGTTWVTLTANKIINAAGAAAATIATGTQGIFECTVGGFTRARITALAAVTGTAALTVRTVRSTPNTIISGSLPTGSNTIGNVGQNGSWTINPGNVANSTAWKVAIEPSAVLGYNLSLSVLNGANSTMLSTPKNTACCIHAMVISNNNATTPYYFKLYDAASNVTLTTADPKFVFRIAPNTTFEMSAIQLRMLLGICYAVTTGPDKASVTGVATANDVIVNIMYL